MLIKKEDTQKIQNGENCTVMEYQFSSKKLGISTAQMVGRFPEKGAAINTACSEIYFGLSGEATVHYNGEEFLLNPGDAFFFEKNEPYWLYCKKLEALVINAPAWSPNQYRISDKIVQKYIDQNSSTKPIIRKSEAVAIKNSKNDTVHEYYFPSKELGFATAQMDGRYPEEGYAKNKICLQIYYVLNGEAIVHYKGKDFKIKPGDSFFFDKEEPYSLTCRKLEVAVVNTPAWYLEQYEIKAQ